MTTTDIFIGVTIMGLVVCGLIATVLGFSDYYVIGVMQSFNANLTASVQPGPAVDTLLSSSSTFSTFFPDLALALTVVLIAETWLLSAFIKSHPLAAVVGIISLVGYTIASFFVSNAMVSTARGLSAIPSFATYLGFANPLLTAWIYLPYILIVASIIDLTIALVSARA